MGVGDEDVIGLVIAEFPVRVSKSPPPLNLRHRIGVNVTRDVVSLAGPDVHTSCVISRELRLV